MTVRINKPALNLREELTKAQGVVRYEQRQFWMDGLVENGTFDSDISGWSVGGSGSGTWSVSAGRVSQSGQTSFSSYLSQPIKCVVGKKYKLTFEVYSQGNGNANIGIGNTGSGVVNYVWQDGDGTGFFSGTFTATSETHYIVIQEGTATIPHVLDNFTVFEADANDEVIHSLPLGFKPVHVYEDGLLQREGDVHDYTVVKTGGAYAIKPTVQPTGATETCVIAEREL